MLNIDDVYIPILERLINTDVVKTNRTGTDSKYLFSESYTFKVDWTGFPILQTKKVMWASVVKELLWFLSGSSDVNDLGCGIWDAWAPDKEFDSDGNLKPRLLEYAYGTHWRCFPVISNYDPLEVEYVDQLSWVINELKTNKYSRRMVVSAWEPGVVYDIPKKAGLAPCHYTWVLSVEPNPTGGTDYLNLHLTQRSADMFLGVPFNIASYSLLLCLIANEVGLLPGTFGHTMVDCHLYLNHLEQAREQVDRYYSDEYKIIREDWPSLVIALTKPVLAITEQDIKLEYVSMSAIKAPIAT